MTYCSEDLVASGLIANYDFTPFEVRRGAATTRDSSTLPEIGIRRGEARCNGNFWSGGSCVSWSNPL